MVAVEQLDSHLVRATGKVPSSWIVVPDGLAADQSGRALPQPSFVYRAVLDWTAQHARPDDRIYLAPANRFGGHVTEQEAGQRYLEPRTAATIVTCPSPDPGEGDSAYINTRGNARLLRRWLESREEWPLPEVQLVAYRRHLRRASLSFAQEGFLLAHTHAVPLASPASEPIVGRLWYYRYPAAHRGYETLATLLTLCRVI